MKKEHQTQIERETRNWIANPFRAFEEEFTLSLSRQSTKKVFKCGTKITSDYWKKFQTFGELDISKWGCEICRFKAWIIEKEVVQSWFIETNTEWKYHCIGWYYTITNLKRIMLCYADSKRMVQNFWLFYINIEIQVLDITIHKKKLKSQILMPKSL